LARFLVAIFLIEFDRLAQAARRIRRQPGEVCSDERTDFDRSDAVRLSQAAVPEHFSQKAFAGMGTGVGVD
jgi:hypothetical protein